MTLFDGQCITTDFRSLVVPKPLELTLQGAYVVTAVSISPQRVIFNSCQFSVVAKN
ncbi:MAG: hypothetical protein NT027_19175 [Proteobacteria bacterium]|nr:hypothetical protein [Pseudomonadota bacterium]